MFLSIDQSKKRVPFFFDAIGKISSFLEGHEGMWGDRCVEPRDRSSHRYNRVPLRNDLETTKERKNKLFLCLLLAIDFTFFIIFVISNILFFIFYISFLAKQLQQKKRSLRQND